MQVRQISLSLLVRETPFANEVRPGFDQAERRQARQKAGRCDLAWADAWIQVYPLRMVINYAIEPQMLWKVPDLFASQ